MSWYLNKKLKKKKKAKNIIQYKEVDEDLNADADQEDDRDPVCSQDLEEYEDDGVANNDINAGIFQSVDIDYNTQLEEEKVESTINNGGVQSDAWPDEVQDQIQLKAKAHLTLKQLGSEGIDMRKAYFRLLNETDLEEVKNLHEEWFPLTYGPKFYEKIANRTIIAIGCFYDINKKSKKKKKSKKESILLGAILTRIQDDNDEITEIYKAKDMGSSGITGFISSLILCRQYQAAYIMTIGVVDECRRFGLGTMLLREITKTVNEQYPYCEILYLHVVDYNESAIRFYEKNKFSTLKRNKSHYMIYGKEYDALVLYKDIKFNPDLQYDIEQLQNRSINQDRQETQGYISYFIGRPYKYVKSIILGH